MPLTCLPKVWTQSAPCLNSFQALSRLGHDRQLYHFVKRPGLLKKPDGPPDAFLIGIAKR